VKYVQPYGISDPDAPYINGDPSISRMGSIPPAEAFEHPMRELVAVVHYSKETPTSDDLEQVSKGIRSQRMNYCEDTGSVNNLSVALDPPLQAYTIGLPLRVRIRETNTGPTTIDAGAGRVPVRKPNGAEMAASDLPKNGLAELVYDGTVFQMINFGGAGAGGAGDVFLYKIPYTVDTSTVANTIIANFTGTGAEAITSYVAGLIFMVKIANTNTSFSNINVNGLGLRPIYAQGGHPNWPLLAGDLQVGDTIVFIYDGTNFWIYPNNAITQNITLNVSATDQVNQLFAALGRKRIATSGSLTIMLGAGIYGPPATSNTSVMVTYHADSDRITVQGAMKAGMTPPTSGHFVRSGYEAAYRANDAVANISMLRGRYATEIKIGSNPGVGIAHTGPGKIRYKNLLVTGPNFAVNGQRGISCGQNSAIFCDGCSVWGSGDVGYGADSGGSLSTTNCHANICATRGFAATGGANMSLVYGGSYSNGNAGTESSHGASIGSQALDSASLSLGFQASCNAGTGMQSVAGYTLAVLALVIVNGYYDFYAVNGGTVGVYLCSFTTTSPALGTVGGDGSNMIFYG
jgi:hypothetical protein